MVSDDKCCVMKRMFHLCISSPDEIMFRCQEDYLRAFNYFALASYSTDTLLLCDSIMSNHIHSCVISSRLHEMASEFKYSYTRYFNSRYMRKGSLGEKIPFILKVEGARHILAALSYTLRNPFHHGVASTPFGYEHSSANIFFQKELGKVPMYSDSEPKSKYGLLPSRANCPSHFRLDSRGMFTRESVLEVSQVELMYGSARNYLFYMNRLSGEKWENEQKEDKDTSMEVVKLETIEKCSAVQDYSAMLMNEKKRYDSQKIRDIELCEEIDNVLVPRCGRRSVYTLTQSEKDNIANYLYSRRVSESQIRRCLCYAYSR